MLALPLENARARDDQSAPDRRLAITASQTDKQTHAQTDGRTLRHLQGRRRRRRRRRDAGEVRRCAMGAHRPAYLRARSQWVIYQQVCASRPAGKLVARMRAKQADWLAGWLVGALAGSAHQSQTQMVALKMKVLLFASLRALGARRESQRSPNLAISTIKSAARSALLGTALREGKAGRRDFTCRSVALAGVVIALTRKEQDTLTQISRWTLLNKQKSAQHSAEQRRHSFSIRPSEFTRPPSPPTAAARWRCSAPHTSSELCLRCFDRCAPPRPAKVTAQLCKRRLARFGCRKFALDSRRRLEGLFVWSGLVWLAEEASVG